MLDQLQDKQRVLLSSIEKIKFTRDAISLINNDEKLVALVGARGVGKTTLLLQYISSMPYDEVLYFSADDISITDIGLYKIADEFYKLGGRLLVIDEIHSFANWASHIKNIYDFLPDMKIRISGSSMLNILLQSYDLSRRVVVKKLNTLRFDEYLKIQHNITIPTITFNEIVKNHCDISFQLTNKNPKLFKFFADYLKIGYYPYFLTSDSYKNFVSKLYNSLEKIIYEDIPATNNIKFENLSNFKKLIYKIITAGVPFEVQINTLAKDLGLSPPSLYSYLDILSKTGIFKTIKKYSKKVSKKPAKIYFQNTNILQAVAFNEGIPVNIGTLRETFFMNCFDEIYLPNSGDFNVNETIFEVGGKNKDFKQIDKAQNSYLVIDVDTNTNKRKIPLWLFSLMTNNP
ncbi:MAG: ATP-binding protein [Gammaproteobacteria bacterium]|nr:MAG: ATP-binding protein [Gammaproteobacteria bacterium]